MKALSTIKATLAIAAISLFMSCNDAGGSKKDKKEKDTPAPIVNDTPAVPPPPTEPPPGVVMLPATQCFENEGLKYTLQVRIEYTAPDKANVEVNSTDLSSGKKTSASFPCDIKDDQLLVKSVSNLPPAGDASQWIANKNWVIDANKPKQTLLIPFNAKNYETNKWEEMKYAFDPCQ